MADAACAASTEACAVASWAVMAPTCWAAAALAAAAAAICALVVCFGVASATPCVLPTMAATMAPTPTARRAERTAEAIRVFVPTCVLTTDSFIDRRFAIHRGDDLATRTGEGSDVFTNCLSD